MALFEEQKLRINEKPSQDNWILFSSSTSATLYKVPDFAMSGHFEVL